MSREITVVVLAFALGLAASASAAEPVPKVVDSLPLAELLGTAKHGEVAKQGRAVKGTVVLFLGTECPVSNGYAPEMQRIFEDAAKRDVAVVGVYAEPSVTAAEAEAHGKEYGLTFKRSLDPEQAIARAAGVTRMPTAVVFDSAGKVVYRGRIDDRWSAQGKRRDEPRTRELRAAIDAVVEGREPEVREAPPFGCPLPMLKPTK